MNRTACNVVGFFLDPEAAADYAQLVGLRYPVPAVSYFALNERLNLNVESQEG